MSRPPVGLPVFSIRAPVYKYSGFEVVWAGQGPREGSICLGSEEGVIGVGAVESDGVPRLIPFGAVPSAEAINGVAFGPTCSAITTRADLTIGSIPRAGEAMRVEMSLDRGAHGVIATPNGRFAAPLGLDGVFLYDPDPTALRSRVIGLRSRTDDWYHAASFGSAERSDRIAFALRRGGLAWAEVGPSDVRVRLTPLPGFDAIDVCPIGDPSRPFAAAVLAADGSLLVTPDLSTPSPFLEARWGGPVGTGYRLLRSRGHLLVLTSERLVLLPDFLGAILGSAGRPAGARRYDLPTELVDAAVAWDRWLLLVRPDGSLMVEDVDRLVLEALEAETGSLSTRELHPVLWSDVPVAIMPA